LTYYTEACIIIDKVMPIRILAPEVVSRIAAGEVVERPASVVKELVENSLDASASQVSVEVRGGGVSLIRVTDNGEGIPAAEVELAFQRYATSKIGGLDDLQSITSLGFRGEALPSIAAVAEVDIVTRRATEVMATYLSLKEGTVVSRGKQARSPGTTVTVHNLFRSLPARLKFLKSPATEASHIANTVSHYALAFPEVRFTLTMDGRTVLRTAGSGQLIESAIEVYGLEIARNLLEVTAEERGWAAGVGTRSVLVSGMVSSPKIARSGRDYLSFFVNRRWITSRLLIRAVEDAYHGLLMIGRHPVAIINISLPASEMDVNIHPTKSEVRFRNEGMVFGAVQKAVRRTLISQAPVPTIEETPPTYVTLARPGAPPPATHPPATQLPLTELTFSVALPILRLLGQLAGTYIVAEGPDGLYLIDQHAAHERILFERINHQHSAQRSEVQGLLTPVTLELSPRQDETLRAHLDDLAEFGFSIEPFGSRSYLVRTVPAPLGSKDWGSALRELLDSPAGGGQAEWPEKLAISIACHSAIKAGQVLSDDEMRELLRQLERTALPNTCPHGRPTMTHLSSEQLAKEFGRD